MKIIKNKRCIISEFHIVLTKFNDKDILLQSLKEMGYKPVVYDKPVNLYGYRGDKREQKAHIIIPRSQVGKASNDVGFEKDKGNYVLHASEYDHKWRTGERIKTLNKTYAEKKIIRYVNSLIKKEKPLLKNTPYPVRIILFRYIRSF